jgi:Ca2+-binding RTX toxin-like protein
LGLIDRVSDFFSDMRDVVTQAVNGDFQDPYRYQDPGFSTPGDWNTARPIAQANLVLSGASDRNGVGLIQLQNNDNGDTYIVRSPSSAFSNVGFDFFGDGKGDYLFGSNRSDNLYGRGGNDMLIGGSGQDKLYGDEGNDILTGGYGMDRLYGGSGADKMYGGADADRLFMGNGDRVRGGAGNDDFIFGAGASSMRINDFDPNGDQVDAAGAVGGWRVDSASGITVARGPFAGSWTMTGGEFGFTHRDGTDFDIRISDKNPQGHFFADSYAEAKVLMASGDWIDIS